MAIDPGTTLILITCLICTIVLAFAGKETGDKTDTRHDNEQRKRKRWDGLCDTDGKALKPVGKD